jgi:hypothetical protein
MPLHSRGKRRAPFYVLTHLAEDLGKPAAVVPFKDGVEHLHDRHAGLDQDQQFLIEGEQGAVVDTATLDPFIKKELQRLLLHFKDKETLIFKALLEQSRLHRLEFTKNDLAV